MIRAALGVLFAVTTGLMLAPRPAGADTVTLNVPVQLTDVQGGVRWGRVRCVVSALWSWHRPDKSAGGSQVAGGEAYSATFEINNTGAYSGTATVAVPVPGVPQAWIQAGYEIGVDSSSRYVCYVQLKHEGAFATWEPRAKFDTGQQQGFVMQPPAWSMPSGVFVTVQGRLEGVKPK